MKCYIFATTTLHAHTFNRSAKKVQQPRKPKTNNSQKPSEANGQSQKPKAKSQVSMQMKDFSPKIQQIERRTAPQTKKHQKKTINTQIQKIYHSK